MDSAYPAHAGCVQQRLQRAGVLYREYLRGGEQDRLAASIDHLQHAEQGQHGFTGPHLAEQQPTHRLGAAKILANLAVNCTLAGRETKGEPSH